jgi:hypothetical protein
MCLSAEDFKQNQGLFYTPEQIRASIEHESIANMRETREYFEQASRAEDFESRRL